MAYLTITEEDELEILTDAIAARERELYYYDMNIANYGEMVKSLPAVSSDADVFFDVEKNSAGLDAAMQASSFSPRDKDELDRFKYAVLLTRILSTEKQQRERSNLVLNTLKERLPANAETALAAARDRYNAAKSAAANKA